MGAVNIATRCGEGSVSVVHYDNINVFECIRCELVKWMTEDTASETHEGLPRRNWLARTASKMHRHLLTHGRLGDCVPDDTLQYLEVKMIEAALVGVSKL